MQKPPHDGNDGHVKNSNCLKKTRKNTDKKKNDGPFAQISPNRGQKVAMNPLVSDPHGRPALGAAGVQRRQRGGGPPARQGAVGVQPLCVQGRLTSGGRGEGQGTTAAACPSLCGERRDNGRGGGQPKLITPGHTWSKLITPDHTSATRKKNRNELG